MFLLRNRNALWGEILSEFGFTDVEPGLLKSINDLVRCGAGDYFYSEYASNAPGSRTEHRNSYIRDKTVLKNRVRILCGLPVKGASELKELEGFLESRGQFIVNERFPTYTKMGEAIVIDIVECFGLKKSLAQTLVGVCGDRYGYGKVHGAQNESSGWNAEHLQAIPLPQKERGARPRLPKFVQDALNRLDYTNDD